MNFDPVLQALKLGEQFPLRLLKHESEALAAFWPWWWETKFDGTLERPKTVQDDDAILEQTSDKQFVDTFSHEEFFAPILRKFIGNGQIPKGVKVPRDLFRQKVIEILLPEAPPCSQRSICFTGGGYGAGKTVTLQFMLNSFDIQMKT